MISSALMVIGAVLMGVSVPQLTASAASIVSPVLLTAAPAAGGLDNLGSVFTQIGQWMTSMLTTITEAPILLIGLGIFVFGAVIGLAYRLIRG